MCPRIWLTSLALFTLVVGPLSAQPPVPPRQPAQPQQPPGPPKPVPPMPQMPMQGMLNYQNGPCKGKLGDIAEVDVPAGYRFLGKSEMNKFLTLTQNIPNGMELGVIRPVGEADWFIIFEFEECGYVKDDEKDKLDANALLDGIRKGTEAGNAERLKRGWPRLNVGGWDPAPFYDTETNNLTWGVLINEGGGGGSTLNYNARLLGRRGVMSANLLVEPKQKDATVPTFKKLLTGYSFTPGQKYSEFRSGDKVAAYGLAALIAGGAAAAAAKSGLLGKLLKPIIAGIVIVCSAIGGFFKKIFGGGTQSAEE